MKIVIVTGSSRGIGASTALECAKRGMGVVVTYNTNPDEVGGVIASLLS
ncbi:NAD(P)-dependent dehydrogenase (short-subunit alcohol dehydrogenase family) [Paraburkholderia sp. GAS333]